MKKFFSIIAVALTMCAATANAQFGIGLKGGLNLTSVSFSNISGNLDTDNQTGFFVGPTMKFTLPLVGFGIDASALYNQTQTKIAEADVKSQSVAVPVNLRWSPLPVLPVYLYGGPQFDFNLGDKEFALTKDALAQYKLKDSNLSVNVGVGATISHIQLSVNYNIACGTTGEMTFKEAAGTTVDTALGKAKNNSWQISAAYYF